MTEIYNFEITANDGCKVPVTLTKDDLVFNIPTDAEVKAALISRDRTKLIAGPVVLSSAAAGSDWANSLVVVDMSAADLAGVSAKALVEIEIQVTESGGDPVTWYHPDGVIYPGLI